ncbi:hypothetical protein V6N13_002399 [Hibiscus sabdariffa]
MKAGGASLEDNFISYGKGCCLLLSLVKLDDLRVEEEKDTSKFKRLCVFCGSSSGRRKIFSEAALELGNELVKRKVDLVYGGGSVGLMGLISQTVHDGECHGNLPGFEFLKSLFSVFFSSETVISCKHKKLPYCLQFVYY